MVKKQYCDFCGNEIDFELEFEVEIYNHTLSKDIFIADVCEKCKKKVLNLLTEMKEKKK